MKAVIQRVTAASVTGMLNNLIESFKIQILFSFLVEDTLISSISKGLCILVGISNDDDSSDVEYM